MREAEALEKIYKPLAKEKQKEAGELFGEKHPKQEVLPNSAKALSPINTRKIVADKLGIGHDTLHKLKTLQEVRPTAEFYKKLHSYEHLMKNVSG